MADCKITYSQGKGFWISETFMQLVLHYIYEELVKPQYTLPNKALFLEDMDFKINGHADGYMTLGWGNFIQTNTDVQTMTQVLQNTKTYLQNQGGHLSLQQLREVDTEDTTFKYMLEKKPFPTSELIKVLEALLQMLAGTWNTTSFDMSLNY